METALHEGNLTDEFNAVFGDEPSEDDIIDTLADGVANGTIRFEDSEYEEEEEEADESK